jgi:hypothetical protein
MKPGNLLCQRGANSCRMAARLPWKIREMTLSPLPVEGVFSSVLVVSSCERG